MAQNEKVSFEWLIALEEERDERQGQAMDLLEKLDRDKREKSAALADLGHQLEAEVDRLDPFSFTF